MLARTQRRFPKILLSWGLGVGLLLPLAARAELPPWVYGEQQRQAPVVVRLEVVEAGQDASEWQVRGRVLKVLRQPGHGQLQAMQWIRLRYPLPDRHSPQMVGPAPVPVLRPGQTVTAWLKPLAGVIGSFAPAAGGRSFGPPMEGVVEPK